MIVLIDNYDSFTFNLVHYLGGLGAEVVVHRNDKIGVKDVVATDPEAVVLSPGPCTPNEAGICLDLIREAAADVPILGVCLGHQAIGEAFGGDVVRADRLMHGKTTMVTHTGTPLFEGIPSPFEAMRYHSLIVARQGLPAELEITAWSSDRPALSEIMALQHRTLPVFGVQFHPESVGTKQGKRIVSNFLSIAADRAAAFSS